VPVLEEIEEEVQRRAADQHGAVLFGVFEKVKHQHVKYGAEQGCGCDFCIALDSYIRVKILQHRLKKKLRDDWHTLIPRDETIRLLRLQIYLAEKALKKQQEKNLLKRE